LYILIEKSYILAGVRTINWILLGTESIDSNFSIDLGGGGGICSAGQLIINQNKGVKKESDHSQGILKGNTNSIPCHSAP